MSIYNKNPGEVTFRNKSKSIDDKPQEDNNNPSEVSIHVKNLNILEPKKKVSIQFTTKSPKYTVSGDNN